MHGPTHRWVATCAPGLERCLAREIDALAPESAQVTPGGVEMTGRLDLAYRANLLLRTASRVLLRVESFSGANRSKIARRVGSIAWETLLAEEQATELSVRVTGRPRQAGPSVESVVWSSIEARFRSLGLRPPKLRAASPQEQSNHAPNGAESTSSGSAARPQLLFIRAAKGRLSLSLDSSGLLLHKRGYRLEMTNGDGTNGDGGGARGCVAPMRETLAAGILLEAGYDGSAPLVDAMTGSGTFGVEGAWIARNIGSGTLRCSGGGFAFERWPSFREAMWRHIQKEAGKEQLDSAPQPIVCRDVDDSALDQCREACCRAGVENDVEIESSDFFVSRPPRGVEPGLVVMNPPYGRRMETSAPAKQWAVRLGRRLLKKWKGWSFAMVLPSARWTGYLDLPITNRVLLPHGGLKVTVVFGRIPSGRESSS